MDIFERKIVNVTPIERVQDAVRAKFKLDNGEEIEACVKFMFDGDELVSETTSYERRCNS